MAFYQFGGESKPRGRLLRTGLDSLRDGIAKLTRINADMAQMNDAQIVDEFDVLAEPGGNTALQQAAGLKAELASDVGKLLTDGSQSGVQSALNQLLAQTG
jgi:hypothetical protein